MWFILDADYRPIAATQEGYMEWLIERGGEKTRIVDQYEQDGVLVSTVYLGLNHRLTGSGPPILWETMIFADDNRVLEDTDGLWDRYTSLKDAKLGHKRAVWHVRGTLDRAKSARSA